MSQHRHTRTKKSKNVKTLLAGLFAASVGLLTTAGVYAALSGVATGSEAVSTGTLNLTLSPDVGVGFSNFVNKMAPGDTNNVYVNLNNTGTLASAAGMTLWVAGTPANALTNGTAAGEGLTVTATQCSVAWTLATGCARAPPPPCWPRPGQRHEHLGHRSEPVRTPSLIASTGKVAHVQVSLGLVGNETSTNGVAPTPTIQGLSTTLAYTFTEQQRTGVATNQ